MPTPVRSLLIVETKTAARALSDVDAVPCPSPQADLAPLMMLKDRCTTPAKRPVLAVQCTIICSTVKVKGIRWKSNTLGDQTPRKFTEQFSNGPRRPESPTLDQKILGEVQ